MADSSGLKQSLLEFVPATGEIAYSDLHNAVVTSGNRGVIRVFHEMRRSGELSVRLLKREGGGVEEMFVSRPVASGGDA